MLSFDILGAFFLLGLVHALEADHLSAVASFVARRSTWMVALGQGMRWAIGHGTSLLILGSILYFLKASFSASWQNLLECGVGLGLILAGIFCIADVFLGSVPKSKGSKHPALWMGILHGMAGTGALVGQVLAVAGSSSYVFVVGNVFAFNAGVFIAMSIYAAILGKGVSLSGKYFHRARGLVQMGIGLWTLLLGGFWSFRAFVH